MQSIRAAIDLISVPALSQQMKAMISKSSPKTTKKTSSAESEESDDSLLLFQTSQNTVDVRGRRADAAIEEVETALTREGCDRAIVCRIFRTPNSDLQCSDFCVSTIHCCCALS